MRQIELKIFVMGLVVMATSIMAQAQTQVFYSPSQNAALLGNLRAVNTQLSAAKAAGDTRAAADLWNFNA